MQKEYHAPQFRGVWTPPEIFKMIEEKKLTAQEAFLLAIIDSLVTPNKGCYASNQYLRNQLGVSVDTITRAITKLKNLGLLRQVDFDGKRRYLETAWSRIDQNPPLAGSLRKSAEAASANLRNRESETELRETHTPFPVIDGDADMLFQDIPTKQSKTNPSPEDQQFAIRLRKLLQTSKRMSGPCNIMKWANHFRLLREVDEMKPEQIESTMEWFANHVTDKYTPRVFNAEQFRAKYAALVEAAKRDTETRDAEVKEFSEDTFTVFNRLGLQWPTDTDLDDVLEAIELSLDNYFWLRDKIRKTLRYGGYAEGSSTHAAISRLLSYLSDGRQFIGNWFREVNHIAWHWKEWKGNPKSFIFSTTANRFLKEGRKLFLEYSGRATDFDKIMQVINAS